MFQSTPLREGRLFLCINKNIIHYVSIHAPTRGATNIGGNMAEKLEFQSTPLREGRLATFFVRTDWSCFNPRPYARGDNERELQTAPSFVSIHAPTRGATALRYGVTKYLWFQSTPLREGRLIDAATTCNRAVSIHAPTRGATNYQNTIQMTTTVSIHAPTRGATGQRHSSLVVVGVSIHAPTRGATNADKVENKGYMFQSTPLREGRRVGCTIRPFCKGFNPRPYARGDTNRITL